MMFYSFRPVLSKPSQLGTLFWEFTIKYPPNTNLAWQKRLHSWHFKAAEFGRNAMHAIIHDAD